VKYYLAYGMNTNIANMAARCPAARNLGKAVLKDHKLAFKHHADAVRSPGSEIECALWLITNSCEASLDILEGYPFYYNKKMVDADFNGTTVRAMIYFMTDNQNYGRPAEGYMNMMLDGYREHGMDTKQIYRAQGEVCRMSI
jgi:gamma-glutamylcyclotransferase (GGCT)/AIG2-like uncharacterized protein YtfP